MPTRCSRRPPRQKNNRKGDISKSTLTDPKRKPSPAKNLPSKQTRIAMEPKTPEILRIAPKADLENYYKPSGTRKRKK